MASGLLAQLTAYLNTESMNTQPDCSRVQPALSQPRHRRAWLSIIVLGFLALMTICGQAVARLTLA